MQMIERVARAIDPKLWRAVETGKDFVESAGRKWEGSYEQQTIEKKLALSRDRAKSALNAVHEFAAEIAGAGAEAFFTPLPRSIEEENARAASVIRLAMKAALQESKETEG
jgi:hypothetical protein